AITRAQQIFVPTQTVANTVEQYYQRSSAKILVTKEGIAEELLNKAQTMNTTTRESGCILYVGSLYPHKNIGVVLKALQELPKYRLEIIGSRNVFQDSVRAQVTELGLEKQVTFLGKVSDTTLAQHYAAAELVIQPSFSEGFGLTGLEALAFSTPVVAADTPIFHEVYQTAAEYFDPHSVKDCIRAILTATQEQTWQRLSKQAATVTRQYNWDVLVQKTFAAYTRQLE
nr:glycosyltransferase [Candidatus Woesebacteria bacterium]